MDTSLVDMEEWSGRSSKSTSFTTNGKLNATEVETLLKKLDDFKQLLSKELENNSNSDARWRVSMYLDITG